jgi:hypothetical protein
MNLETGWTCPQCGQFNSGTGICQGCGEPLGPLREPSERFGYRVTEDDVACILSLIANPPDLRDEPEEGDLPGDFHAWFDGGAIRNDTGSKTFKFADGTTAWVAVPAPYLHVQIVLPSGERVAITQLERPGQDQAA